jgi:hypothetical protein
VFLAIHVSIGESPDDHFLILTIVLIKAALKFLNDSPVVGVVGLHAFGEVMYKVKKTKLTNDCGPKDEFEKIKEL